MTFCGNENLPRDTSDGIDYISCPDWSKDCDYSAAFWGLASKTVSLKDQEGMKWSSSSCLNSKQENRKIFLDWLSKVISCLHCVCLITHCVFGKPALLSQPMRNKTKTNHFPTLYDGYMYLLQIMIGMFHCAVCVC